MRLLLQVFEKRILNNMAGLFMGNVCQAKTPILFCPCALGFDLARSAAAQGFSIAWWKDKHNTHHAVPNKVNPIFVIILPGLKQCLHSAAGP